MSYLNINLNDVAEPKPLEKGKYEVQITDARMNVNTANGKESIRLTLGFPDHPDAPTFNQFVALPTEDDDKAAFKMLMLKRFLTAFNIPFSADGIDTDMVCQQALGQTAVVEIGLTKPTDERPEVYNTMILPKLPAEGSEASHSRRRR